MASNDGRIKDRLLDAAIDQFGRMGFEAVSTRDIAAAANATMSAIAYHFGSKEGLQVAVAEHIAERLGARMFPAVAAAAELASGGPPDDADARAAILSIVDALADAMLSPETTRYARFVVREQMSPSPAFEVIYERVISRVLGTLERLIGAAVTGLGADEARRTALTIVGQVIVLQAARATAARTLDWAEGGPTADDPVRSTIARNVRAILDGAGARG